MQTATTRSAFRLPPILFLILVSSLSGARAFQEGVLITAADLDAYLAQKGSPMVGEGAHYLKWGQSFNVDPRLVIAVSGAESTFGQKPCGNQFNVWGWKPEGECWAGFEPGLDADTNQPQFQNAPGFVPGKGITMETGYEDGIFWVTENLRRGYLDQGLNTVAQIAPKWCQEGCENWEPNVEQFMREMGGDPNHLLFPQETPEASDGTIMPIEGLPYSFFPSDDGEPKRTADPRSWYSTVYRGKYEGHWTTRGEGSGSHPGVDIRVDSGTPVRAIADGVVDARIPRNAQGGDNGGWGGLVVIRHDNLPNTTDPVYSIYAHLREWYVNKNDTVRKGDIIGKSGGGASDPNRGNSTGPHLHFQMDRDTVNSDGKTVFTSPWFPSGGENAVNTPDSNHLVEQYTYHPVRFIEEQAQKPQYLYIYTKQYPEGFLSLQVNEVLEVEIDYQNTGTTTWANTGGLTNMNYIELRSVDKNGVQVDSALFHESWIDRQRIGSYLSQQKGVAPGQIARFVFKIRANSTHFAPGDAKFVYFRPYHATGGWMPESDWGPVHLKIRVGSEKMSANLFQINGKVLNADGSVGKNGLFVVVMNTSDSRRVAKDTTGSFAGDGRYVVTFFDPNAPVARADDLFEVTVIEKAGNILAQKEQRLTEADIQAFTTSIDVKLKPTPTGPIGANLFSISGTVYTADGTPVEAGFSVKVQNTSKPSLVVETTTGAVAGDGGYIATFFNLAEPVAEGGDVVEITVLDQAGNPFAQKRQTLTEADVKAFGVTIDLTQQTGLPLETRFESPHFTIDYAMTGADPVYRPDLTTAVDGKVYPKYVVVLAEALEEAHATYLQNGFADPIGQSQKMKVTLKGKLANDALGESHHEVFGIGRIVIDNDMNPTDRNDPKPTDELVFDTLRVTAAHELFHHVQERHVLDFTSIFISDFLKEGTAVWAEDLVFDGINYYIRRRINPTTPKITPSFMENSDQPLLESAYNSVLFWKHLTEHHAKTGQTEAQVILEIWEEANPGDTNPENLIQKVTSKNFKVIFQDWLIANYALNLPHLDREKDKPYTYRESGDGIGYGQLQIPGGHQVSLSPERPSHEWTENVNAWAADYFVVRFDSSILEDFTIEFDGQKSGLSASDDFVDVQILLIKDDNLYQAPMVLALDSGSDGSRQIPAALADRIVIIVGGADDGGDYTLSVKTGEAVLSLPSDVNADSVVNVFDLVQVASQFGQSGAGLNGDVNGDGVVNVFDLVLISSHFGGGTVAAAPERDIKAPIARAQRAPTDLERIHRALAELEAMPNPSDGAILARQRLRAWLADEVPITTETKLFPNYPNPFNPETWIPYRLSQPSFVAIRIWDVQGRLVRTLELGHRPAGYYLSRERAAYWDGRNEAGELVSSGVYFYQLRAGDFTAVLRMVLLK